MKLLQFFRSPTFALYAVGAWLVSFLVIFSSQAHNNISYIILLIPTLFTLQIQEIRRFFSHPLSKGLLAVILTLILAAQVGDSDPWRQVKFGLIVLLFFIAVARLPFINNRTAYKAAWGFLGLITIYVILNAGWQFHQGIWSPGARLGDLSAKLENVIYVTNVMGGMLAIITLIGLQEKRYREVIIGHALVLLLSLTILQTRSIIGIWALIILLTSLSLYRTTLLDRKFLISLAVASLVIGLAIAGLIAFTPIGDNLLARKFYRFEIWSGFIAETLRCGLWFGCGPDHAFRYISYDGIAMLHPHSIFVTQFYKAGLIGLTPLIALTIWAISTSYKTRSWAGWYFIVGILGLCFDGSSIVHSPSQRWLVFHLPLALLISQQLHLASNLKPVRPKAINGGKDRDDSNSSIAG